MNRTTILWTILLALCVGLAVFWQRGREAAGEFDWVAPLFEDVEPSRITRIRVEHAEYALELTLERDAAGAWYLTDPIAYPADTATLRTIFEAIGRNRLSSLPGAIDPAELGLDPPRAVIEVTEELEDGPRRQTVELGVVDLDGRRVVVRTRGRVGRTGRNLDSVFDRGLHDYRSRSVAPFHPQTAVAVRREGRVRLEEGAEELDLALVAVRDVGEWRVTAPAAGRADPAAMAAFAAGLAGLQAESFVDRPDPDLAALGLDPPAYRVEVETAAGELVAVRFGRLAPGEWTASREGSGEAWRIAPTAGVRFAQPSETFLDAALVRVVREDVAALVLSSEGASVRIERAPARPGRPADTGWSVAERPRGAAEYGPAFPADAERVADLLGRIERARFVDFEIGREHEPAPGGEEILLETTSGAVEGGEFGPEVALGGETLRRFRRGGDRVVGLLEPGLVELARTSPAELRSRRLLAIDELALTGLVVRAGADERAFRRDPKGPWYPEGAEAEASERFYAALERLLFLEALEHLSVPPELGVDPVELELRGAEGDPVRVALHARPAGAGADADGDADEDAGGALAEIDGVWARLAEPDLRADWAALARGQDDEDK